MPKVGTLPAWAIASAIAAIAFIGWLVAVILWVGPGLAFSHVLSVGTTPLRALGAFGDSFGVVTAAFSGVAVVLVFLAYRSQRQELLSIRSHFGMEQRRQRSAYLIERLERQLREVGSGELSGANVIRWMGRELGPHFEVNAAVNRPSDARWAALLDEPGLPDCEPLASAVYSIVALAQVGQEMEDQRERAELSMIARSVITREALAPLLFACAKVLRGDAMALSKAASFFRTLGLMPDLISAFDLSAVPESA